MDRDYMLKAMNYALREWLGIITKNNRQELLRGTTVPKR